MTRAETKIFGVRIPVDQKVFAGGFAAVLALVLWFNFFRGDADDHPVITSRPVVSAKTVSPSPVAAPTFSQAVARREAANRAKQGVLRFKPVDPTNGDVDPTLKLWLLDKVRAVKPLEGGRNLFETGPEIAQGNLPPIPATKTMMPKSPQPIGPMPPVAAGPVAPPPLNIPLRYYGFVKPGLRTDGNRGYFMDGENILMATEGDVLESRFLVVTLSPNTARVEDIQLKQGQDLQLIPEATVAQ
jgi:hypothetical protein